MRSVSSLRKDPQIRPGKLRDIGKFCFQNLGTQVGAVKEYIIFVRSPAAAFLNFLDHAPGDDVPGGKVFDGGRVSLHKSFTRGIAQDCAFATSTFGEQNAQARKSGGMELEELHVFQGDALAPNNPHAITGEGVGIGSGLVNLPKAARRKHHRLRVEHVDISRGQFVGNNPGCFLGLWLAFVPFPIRVIDHDQVQHIELVVELDTEFHAVLKKSLQDHVTGAVCGVARPAHGSFTVISGVTTEPALVDFSIGRSVEGETHIF